MTLNANNLPTAVITEELLNEYFMKPFLKIIAPVAILIILGTIAIALTKKILPRKLAIIAEAAIKIITVILIGLAVSHKIKNMSF